MKKVSKKILFSPYVKLPDKILSANKNRTHTDQRNPSTLGKQKKNENPYYNFRLANPS